MKCPRLLPLLPFLTAILLATSLWQPTGALENSAFKLWQSSLNKYVNAEGLVNYNGWKTDRTELDNFISALAQMKSTEYNALKKEQKLAFWINAYNAITIKQILDHYPIKRSGFNLYPSSSIRQIDGVWDKYQLLIAGRKLSLHNIENDILRREFKEPMVHFAINCASRSCPPLSRKAYLGATLTEQLSVAARKFIQSSQYNQFHRESGKLALSKIFDWYAPDFVPNYFKKLYPGKSRELSAVLSFIEEYAPANQQKLLARPHLEVSYGNYDWSLNEQDTAQ